MALPERYDESGYPATREFQRCIRAMLRRRYGTADTKKLLSKFNPWRRPVSHRKH